MKIAVYHDISSGGGKRALYNFVKYLALSGHVVDVYTPSTHGDAFSPLQQVASRILVFPVKKTLIGLLYCIRDYFPPEKFSFGYLEKTEQDIADVINKQDYDVVLSDQNLKTLSPFFLKYIKKPTVYYCHQPSRIEEVIIQAISQKKNGVYCPQLVRRTPRQYYSKVRKVSQIDRENASFSNYILTNSYYTREAILRSYGLNSFVSYLGVESDIFKPLETPKENFVLSVGSCFPAKGFDFIVKSLVRVPPKMRPRFVIVSNTVDKDWKIYLENLAADFGIALEIKVLVSNDELVQLYNRAKLVLYTPYLEPFGIVPLEAMACGVAIVAIKEGGVRESVVHNESGFLMERDECQFAEAIIELLSNEDKRQLMGKRGREIIQDFWTLKHAGDRLLRHMERAMHKPEGVHMQRL